MSTEKVTAERLHSAPYTFGAQPDRRAGDPRLGFGQATGGDEVFRQLVLARIIEPASKLYSLRVLEEAGIQPRSYRTVRHRLPVFAAG